MSPFEREEAMICEAYAKGEITLQEYNRQIRDLQREENADAQERAETAYRNELNNW